MEKVVLGLGSNLTDRTKNLTSAFRLLIERSIIRAPIRVSSTCQSPALVPDGAPKAWKKCFLNIAIEGNTALSPFELLTQIKQLEKDLGRKQHEKWAPREIDIDILFYSEFEIHNEQLQIPHPENFNRDFILRSLQDLFPNRSEFQRDFSQDCQRIPLQILPVELVGILNVTPDSFSDGNEWFKPQHAKQQAEKLVKAGASIIDIGGESTRPDAHNLDPKEEWERLSPVIKELHSCLGTSVKWSIDTRHHEVAEQALEYGVNFFNDVSAGEDPKMFDIWKQCSQDIVIMHHLGIPVKPDQHLPLDSDPIQVVKDWAQLKLSQFEKKGISPSRLIIDPGIGFGKTAEQNLETLLRVKELKSLGRDLYIGHSRKSFLRLVSQRIAAERDFSTLAVSEFLARQGVSYLRVHNVEAHVEALKTSLLFPHQVSA